LPLITFAIYLGNFNYPDLINVAKALIYIEKTQKTLFYFMPQIENKFTGTELALIETIILQLIKIYKT